MFTHMTCRKRASDVSGDERCLLTELLDFQHGASTIGSSFATA